MVFGGHEGKSVIPGLRSRTRDRPGDGALLLRHHRPCAGDPDCWGRCAFLIGMAGTDPRNKSGDGHDGVGVIPGARSAGRGSLTRLGSWIPFASAALRPGTTPRSYSPSIRHVPSRLRLIARNHRLSGKEEPPPHPIRLIKPGGSMKGMIRITASA
ncbi:hypothetical protein J4G37_13600 [Microvirga sp. 3-52]|nr:hypothetical protein [Microvirga sp. 3-52]